MTQRSARRLIPVMAWLLGASAAWAGSDMFGSLPGHLTATAMAPTAGQTVTITLRLAPSSSASHLKIAFEAPGCAMLEGSSARRADVSLVAGREVRFTTKARIASVQPCKIVASVVQTDEADARTGWVYALVLNEAPAAPSRFTPGHDAAGRQTIDAVAR